MLFDKIWDYDLSFKYEHHKEESARVVKLKRRAAHIYHKDIKTYLFLNKICLKD